MVDVFISYPQRERALMLPIKRKLESLGLILFVDVDGRLDGEATFPEALDKGVRTSKAVLGCWSPWALTRPWVQTECAIGKDENKLVAVERVTLTAGDVPALFYLVDRKPLSDFDGTVPHEGWAMTLSALATKLKLWMEKRPDHPEVAAVREKIVVLEKAAAVERAALDAQQPSRDSGAAPRPAIASDAAERAWAAIERSLDVAHYRRFERTFGIDPAAFVRVIEAEARAKALERWAATDHQNAGSIAETLRTGLFPALQEIAQRSLAQAEEVAKQREAARSLEARQPDLTKTPPSKGDTKQAKAPTEKSEASGARKPLSLQRTVESGHVRQNFSHDRSKPVVIEKSRKFPGEQHAAKYGAEGRIKVDAAIFTPRESEEVQAGWLKPGAGKAEWFKDFDIGPEMVVVPGNPAFAIGRFAVTFAEWDAAQAHPEWQKHSKIEPRNASDHGWGRGKQPVIDVSWNDAEAYCAWASAVTGKAYRLPSEDEWEKACKAGTNTAFWWGNEISTTQANYDGNYTFGNGKKGEYRQRTMPVDSFEANPWGLYQVHGNVWEWCEDTDMDDDDEFVRVIRGGSWENNLVILRSSDRSRKVPENRHNNLGFRVARVLSPTRPL